MRLLGGLLCLALLGLTGYSALIVKAPKIEASIEERGRETLASLAVDGISLSVDGRQVTLEGNIASDEKRQELLDAVSALPGVALAVDRLSLANVVTPYQLGAVKDQTGEVAVAGYAPTEEARAAIIADAHALFGDDASITIDLADGAPSVDWASAAAAAMDALATTREGSLSISGQEVSLNGEVTTEADIEAIQLFADMLPEGYRWSDELSVAAEDVPELANLEDGSAVSPEIRVAPLSPESASEEAEQSETVPARLAEQAAQESPQEPALAQERRVEPYTLSVVKDQRGGLLLKGFAPDDAARAALIDAGKAVSAGLPVVADIEIADGVPDDDWLPMVVAGISALQDMRSGRLEIVDSDVAFASRTEAEADDASEVAAAAVGESQANVKPAVASPVDAAILPDDDNAEVLALTVDKVEQDVWSIRGVVPSSEDGEDLIALIKGHAGINDIDAELAYRDGDADDGWVQFANDHIRTLDVVSAGRLQLEDRTAHLIGVVERPEDIEPVRAVLAAINEDMTVDLQPVDPRPLATLELSIRGGGKVSLKGALPDGLSEEDAMRALGIKRYDGELGEGASGRAEAWRQELAAVGPFLPIFEEIDLTLGDGSPKLNGQVQIHADAPAIADEIKLALGSDRQPLVNIATTSTVHEDGTTRNNPLTGDEETHRRGYWLPLLDIAADEETCREQSSAMLSKEKITFLRGQEALDGRAERILNALAGLAIACLESGDLMLEIGGHTDSRGAAQMNQDLSQARADAVLNALAARGVDVDALIAVGHGERRPIADNSTDDGRAANRRITFDWSATDKAANSAAGSDTES